MLNSQKKKKNFLYLFQSIIKIIFPEYNFLYEWTMIIVGDKKLVDANELKGRKIW